MGNLKKKDTNGLITIYETEADSQSTVMDTRGEGCGQG